MTETTEDYLENLGMALGHLIFKTSKGLATDQEIISKFNEVISYEDDKASKRFIGLIASVDTVEVVAKQYCPYSDHGFKDRSDYLSHLSAHYSIELSLVTDIAELLGQVEDFDSLITSLEELYDRRNWTIKIWS